MHDLTALDELGAEVTLPNWPGPTFFTAEPREPLSKRLPDAVGDHRLATSIVVGSVRDATLREVRGLYCVHETGALVLGHMVEPRRLQFVNTNVALFVTCTKTLLAGWAALRAGVGFDALRAELGKLDAEAMRSRDAFWPQALFTYAGDARDRAN